MEKLHSAWLALKVGHFNLLRPQNIFSKTNTIFSITGRVDCINTLIKYGCDVNLRDADGRPTLYILALENNVSIAKHLLEHSNVNVNLPDNEGRTPLHVAAWQGHLEMVKLLIAEGKFNRNHFYIDRVLKPI